MILNLSIDVRLAVLFFQIQCGIHNCEGKQKEQVSNFNYPKHIQRFLLKLRSPIAFCGYN